MQTRKCKYCFRFERFNGLESTVDLRNNFSCQKDDECVKSGIDSTNYIASRYDLEGQGNFGKIDSKVVNIDLFFKKQCQAISGPTHTHNITPFCWSQSSEASKYKGLPDYNNFDW